METHGDSALKVATQVGVCSHTIYKYLGGEVDPKAFVLTALSDIYGVSTDFLLGLTNEPKRSGYNGSA